MSYQLKNPIIPGYYPDPSIIRVDDDFYLTCSSFEMFPGIPVFSQQGSCSLGTDRKCFN